METGAIPRPLPQDRARFRTPLSVASSPSGGAQRDSILVVVGTLTMLANVTWPSLIYYEREHAWWMILVAVVVEFLILRRSLKTSPARGFGITAIINVFSAMVGSLITFPVGGLGRERPIPWIGLFWAFRVDGTFGLGTGV